MKIRLTMVMGAALMATAVAAIAHNGRHPASPQQIAAALANPARADQAADDARRKAAETIAFTTAGPGSVVIDFLPGRGYWTGILTNVVGPTGHVYALWPNASARRAADPIAAINARGFKNVTAEVLPTNTLSVAAPVDVVLTVENYHDLNNTPAGAAQLDAFNAQVFAALKPGGVYVVIDHADADGGGLRATATTHRIDAAAVKAQVLKAGFAFDAESMALRNPADDHSKNVFDPSIRGHTDQFMFRFKKPVKR